MRIRNKRLTRKERKIERKLKPVSRKLDPESEAYARQLGREMTRMERDRSNDGKVFFKPKKGCNDYVGGIQLCETCHYNFNNQFCHKMREAML